MEMVSFSITTASSPEGCSSGSCSNISTPLTEKSLLFNEPPVESLEDKPRHDQYVLVVGGLGYIGSHTTWELLKEGYNVIIIDNLSNSFRSVLDRLECLTKEYFKPQSQQPSIEFYEADYRGQRTVRAILSKYARSSGTSLEPDGWKAGGTQSPKSSITGVIHFAAYKAVAESIQQPLKYYSNNVGGMIGFCSLLSEFGIKTFVFSSSATVYGELANRGGRIPEEYCTHATTRWFDTEGREQITYGGCTGLTNPYGRTKWMCEAILNDLATSDPEWTIVALRYFNPIGCDSSGMLGEDPRATPNNLMPIVVKVMTEELPVLNVYGTDWETNDGTAIRDFIHVSDLARGHLAALSAASKFALRRGFRVFNLGTGTGHSVTEVVAAMEALSGRPIKTRPVGRRDGDVAMCIAEPSKAAMELNWKTEQTLEDSCEDICRFVGIEPANDGIAA